MVAENIALKKYSTKELKAGMSFTSTVYIGGKNVLVGPNTTLRQQDIDRLIRWEIEEVETEGELICSKKTKEGELLYDLDLVFDISSDPSGLSLDSAAAYTKKRRIVQSDIYEKRDCAVQRSLREYYQSWLDDIDQLYLAVVKGCELDRDESVRIALEIIEKARTDRGELALYMCKGMKKPTYLAEHGVNVALYAAMFGSRLEMKEQDLLNFVLGCLYIDIGMVKLPLSFFSKDTRPSAEELRIIRAHPLHGYQILVQENGFPEASGLVALEHHERVNGQGYPRQLSAHELSSFGSIAAIVDTYEAMTRQRSYRDELISHEAMRTVVNLGQANFDRQYLTTFLREFGAYPVGTCVHLNNNAVAQVIVPAFSSPMRPDVRILVDEFGDRVYRTEIVRLYRESDLKIVRALNKSETHSLFI